MDEHDGNVALITGAGGGLGRAICRRLARCGMTVLAADVRPDAALQTASELRRSGAKADCVALDVCDADAVSGALTEIERGYGRLNVLVNSAGTDVTLPVEELEVAHWDRVVGVNLRGPFLLSHYAFPLMRRQGGGHIVNIVSTAARRTWPNASAYHASKWGLLGLSHALHVEGRAVGIKVTAVISGGMRTPFILDRFPDVDPSTLQAPENVAETVHFVLSQPAETVIPEIMVLPMKETSWP
jgi:NAD(P)-dependent dehydrogenase (short-subunit alcohol dehydrogenase family)